MSFKNLTYIHPGRDTERIKHNIYRLSLLVIGHIFLRHDNRNHTFVPVATSHLVSWLDSALDCQIHLDDLQHTRRKIITLSEFVLLVLKPCVQLDAPLCQLRLRSFQLLVRSLIGHSQLEPIFPREVVQIVVGDFLAFFQLRTTGNNLADQRLLQPLISGLLNNAILIIDVLANLRQLHLFDFDRPLIFFQPIPGKNLHINNGAFNARRHSQRGVFNIRRFLTKDGAK